jgi:iron(III) transport system ATP-binding protein
MTDTAPAVIAKGADVPDVRIDKVTKRFGDVTAVDAMDLSVQRGEFYSFLGPSGCGKTTTLRMIAGFEQPTAGEIFLAGSPVAGVPPYRRNVNTVFQNYALFPHMDVARNVGYGLRQRKTSKADEARRVGEALELVRLSGYERRRTWELSGGQQQRVALARTIAVEPRVLLLDEPLSNLDARLRVHMRRELVGLQRKLGVTTIFVTHDQEEAMTTCDRIAVMDEGVIQQVGTPVELYDRPANRFVAEFVGTINLLPGSLQKAIGDSVLFASPAIGTLSLPWREGMTSHGEAQIAFRPNGVVLAERAAGAERLWMAVTVADREFLGEFVRYNLRVGDAHIIADQPHYLGVPEFRRGTKLQLGIDPAQIQVLRG